MVGALVRAQLRRAGAVAVIPIVVGAVVAGAGWAAATAWPMVVTMTLVTWLEQVFVICVGVSAASALTGDPLVELHESTSTSFRSVQVLRAAILAVSGVIGAIVMFVPLHLAGVWPRDDGWATVLVPAGAVLFVIAVAWGVAAFAGTVSATTIAVIAAWMFLAMLWDPYVLMLAIQRGVPLLAAGVLVILGLRRLGDSEQNISRRPA